MPYTPTLHNFIRKQAGRDDAVGDLSRAYAAEFEAGHVEKAAGWMTLCDVADTQSTDRRRYVPVDQILEEWSAARHYITPKETDR
ncbi:hypothetical protein HGI16_12165 [Brevibacterium casei]|uniref:hypothetical protein n=1 Tax=Brevibacterium casei TaxID=33889 RepID=UPI00186B6C01|nr:hypothetical protein [Brevibacterium casei]MBE4695453.1 hypothetical protein [Brevibacterium casei]MBY3578575.1 hypothetical protein [Brevibacterium casei]